MSVERILLYSRTLESAKVFRFAAFKKPLDVLINLIIYSKVYMGINKILILSFIKHEKSRAGD